MVVNSWEVNASHVKTVVFSFCRSASSSPTRRKLVVVGTFYPSATRRDRSLAQRAGQRKALVDVVFLVGRGIRRQHKAVQQSKAEHQHKNKTVQCQFFC